MTVWRDEDIKGYVYRETQFPNIRYLIDGNFYFFNGHSTLVIGGAYSVDKYHRISKYLNGESHFLGWFPQEQLSTDEMANIERIYDNYNFDFVLTHTCPSSWIPNDLLLNFIDQSTVDKNMEIWMEKFKEKIYYKAWLFGHYHADRIIEHGVQLFYQNVENLEDIYKKWS